LPLVVGANRDERYARPASPMTQWSVEPRLLAGRDEAAGGTWLAVTERGVVAGLTNQPAASGRDPTKRTRGELPLLLAAHDSATAAVEEFATRVNPGDYNPCSLLIGDRDSLYAVELRDGGRAPEVLELSGGRYVLENRPFGLATAKTEYTHQRLEEMGCTGGGEQLHEALR